MWTPTTRRRHGRGPPRHERDPTDAERRLIGPPTCHRLPPSRDGRGHGPGGRSRPRPPTSCARHAPVWRLAVAPRLPAPARGPSPVRHAARHRPVRGHRSHARGRDGGDPGARGLAARAIPVWIERILADGGDTGGEVATATRRIVVGIVGKHPDQVGVTPCGPADGWWKGRPPGSRPQPPPRPGCRGEHHRPGHGLPLRPSTPPPPCSSPAASLAQHGFRGGH
jgi:hypothetical protein